MQDLFPPIEPHLSARLDTGDGHTLYYEVCGNPSGAPALFLHGGPGSSINPGHRRFFDPAHYRIVLFDQRGCGQSTPRGAVEHNTTQDLVQDIERLRVELGVDRWMLFGGSWGSALALAYALAFPAHVCGIVLRGVFLGTREEVDWFLCGLRRFLPEAWSALAKGVEDTSAYGLISHYWQAVCGPDAQRAMVAAQRWSAYENASVGVGEAAPASAAPAAAAPAGDPALIARVRVQLHYLVHDCFLAPGALAAGAARLVAIPAIIVQGRRDLVCPPLTAYTLQRAWPGAELRMIEAGGHLAQHPAIAGALVQATQDMKQVTVAGAPARVVGA